MRIARGARRSAVLPPRVRAGLAAALVSSLLFVGLSSALAGEAAPPPGWREVWAGADISTNVWLLYSGVTVAPTSHVHKDGIRIRAAGGYGGYAYSDTPHKGEARTFSATTYFADALVGYQARFGELTAKAFVGASLIGHDITPFDDETLVIGSDMGAKAVVELWLNMGQTAWTSLDLAWSSAYNTRSARARSGYRVWPRVSLGLEAGINVDAQGQCRIEKEAQEICRIHHSEDYEPARLLDYGRAGVFARYDWGNGEISLSAGVLGGSFRGDEQADLDPYVTLNWLAQF